MTMTNRFVQMCACAFVAFPQRLFSYLTVTLLLMFAAGQAGAANNATFVSQTVPTSMVAGQQYSVTITMKNTGTAAWTVALGHGLGAQSPAGNWTWGMDRMPLGTSIGVGGAKAFTAKVTAPPTPGVYTFQWQMMQDGVEWFGAMSPAVSVTVAAPVNNAQFISQTAYTTMIAGSSYNQVVTMKNTGNIPWVANAYSLAAVDEAGTWGRVLQPVPATIQPGSQYSITIPLKAPTESNYYNLQWRMVQNDVEWFGDATPLQVVAVPGPAPLMSVESPLAGDAYIVFGGKIQIPVRISAAPNGIGSITKIQVMEVINSTYYELASELGSVFNKTISISSVSGARTLYLRATDSFNKVTTIAVPITVQADGAYLFSQTVPGKMVPSQPYDVSLTMKNSGTTTWYPGEFKLVSQNPADNTTWGTSTLNLESEVPPGGTAPFNATITAPPAPGTYNFQWRMQNATRGLFGTVTTNVAVVVARPLPIVTLSAPANNAAYPVPTAQSAVVGVQGSAELAPGATIRSLEVLDGTTVIYSAAAAEIDVSLTLAPGSHALRLRATDNWGMVGLSAINTVNVQANAATFSSQTVPTTMVAGQPYTASILMKNTGTTTWGPLNATNPEGYALGPQNPQDNDAWKTRASVTNTIPPGVTTSINVSGTAPAMPGVYNFQWQMLQEGHEYFGPLTPAVQVTVKPTMPVAVLSYPEAGQKFTATAGKAVVPILGWGEAGAGAEIVKVELLDSSTVLITAGGGGIEEPVVLATGAHYLKIRVTDSYGQVTTSASKTVTVVANNASFVANDLPATMVAGQTYTVGVNMKNTGGSVWTAEEGYMLGAQPEGDATWSSAGAPIILPVTNPEIAYFVWKVKAPDEPGTYPFQWQMLHADKEWFGAKSTVVNVVVTAAPPTATLTAPLNNASYQPGGGTAAVTVQGSGKATGNASVTKLEVLDGSTVIATVNAATINTSVPLAGGTHTLKLRATDSRGNTGLSAGATVQVLQNNASFVSQSVPAAMVGGERYTVTVTMKNTGNTTWQPYNPATRQGFALAPQNPVDNIIWRVDNRVPLAAAVAPNANAVFTFDVIAPMNSASYNFQWRMLDEASGPFGALSTNVAVVVTAPAPTVILSAPANGATLLSQNGAVRIQGSATPTAGRTIAKIEVLDGAAVAATVTAASIDTDVPLEPGSHMLQLRVTDSYGAIALSAQSTVTVTHNDAELLWERPVPAVIEAGTEFVFATQFKNTGSTTWQGGTHAVTMQSPLNNTIWRNPGRMPVDATFAPGATMNFMVVLTAPSQPGIYPLQWQMSTESGIVFGQPSALTMVTVVAPAAPTATLKATPNSIRVQPGQSANIALTGVGTQTSGSVTKLEVFKDAGAGYEATPVLTVTGNAASLALDQTLALPYGSYRLKLRATDGGGRAGESAPVIVNVADTRLMGGVIGVRTVGEKVELLGWVLRDPAGAPMPYSVYVHAPSALGGTLIASGTVGGTSSAQASSRMMKRLHEVEYEFDVNLGDVSLQYPGAPLYVEVTPPGEGTPSVLPSEENTATVPGDLRIGLTQPSATNDSHFRAPTSVYLQTKISGYAGELDEVHISVNSTWEPAVNEGAGIYSLKKEGLAPRTSPYKVVAKVRQGATTLLTEERLFYVDAPNAVGLLTPTSGTTLTQGVVVTLTAEPTGDLAAVGAVQFYVAGKPVGIGQKGASVWTYSWTPDKAGVQSIYAVVMDGNGAPLSQSSTVTVTVTAATTQPGLEPIAEAPPHLDNPNAGTLPGSLDVRNDGAATYSMPLVVPPGTAGMQPNLSLNYSSKDGNGLLGLGWSLGGLSSIYRCAKTIGQDGVLGRISFGKADRLCLDGQRLMRISGSAASSVEDDDEKYWQPDAEFRTELDNFSRITRVLSGSVFKVEPKDGRAYYYSAGTSAIAAQGREDGAIQIWSIGKVQDRSGNYMELDYASDIDTGEYTLTKIRYGGYRQNVANPDPALALETDLAVRFEYEGRADAQVQYVGGSRRDLRKRLTHIRTYIGTSADGSLGTLVRDYELHYTTSPSSGRSLIDWVQVCARDPATGKCDSLPKTSFKWSQDTDLTMRITQRTARPRVGSEDQKVQSYLADIDGSGTTTSLIPRPGPKADSSCTVRPVCQEYTLANIIDGFTADDQAFVIELRGYVNQGAFTQMKTGDLNGDGREDLIFLDPMNGKWLYCLSLAIPNGTRDFSECQPGGTFSPALTMPPYRVPMVIGLKRDGRDHVMTPFDSSGKAKDCRLHDDSIVCTDVTMNNLTPGWEGAFPFEKLQPIGLSSQDIPDLYAVWSDIQGQARVTVCSSKADAFTCRSQGAPGLGVYDPPVVAGDYNADGLADFSFNTYTCLSTESNVDCKPIQSPGVLLATANILAAGVQDWLGDGVGHFYGNDVYEGPDAGKERLCHMENLEWVCRSITIEASSREAATEIKGAEVTSRVFFASPNGIPSSLVCQRFYVNVPEKCWLAAIIVSPGLDKMAGVTNGLGNRAEVDYVRGDDSATYSRLATVDNKARTPKHPQLSVDPGALVTQLRRDTGMGHWQTTSFYYEGGLLDGYGRGSLGFALVRRTNEQSKISTETLLRQDFPFIGKQLRTRTYSSSCALSDTSFEVDKKTPVVLGTSHTYFPFVRASSTTRKDLNCSDLGTVKTANDYDELGNIKSQVVTTTGDGKTFTSTTAIEYTSTAVENAHLTGLPKTVQLTRTAPDTPAITRTVAYDYDLGTGLRTSETVEPANPSLRVITSFDRNNSYGLVNTTTQKWDDPTCPIGTGGCVTEKSRTVSVVKYQTNGRFPKSVANALGQTETYTFDAATGTRTSLTGPNQLATRWAVDGFGAIISETRADGNVTKNYYKQCSSTLCPQKPDAAVLRITDQFHGDARIAVPQMLYLDSLGQPLRSQTRGFDSGWVYVERVYDAQGRLDWVGQPVKYDVQHPPIAVRQEYDDLNRVTTVVKLDDHGAEIEYKTNYNGYTSVLSNPLKLANGKLQSRTEKRDVLGQLREVTDSADGKVVFEYDAFGNLIKTTDPSGNQIVVTYDGLGRKTRLNDPNLGEIKYDLDPIGQLLTQTNPEQAFAGKKTKFEYDALGRMTARYESDLDSHWVYDTAAYGIGRLAEAYTGKPELKDYRRVHEYDEQGRPARTTQTVGGVDYSTSVFYDDWNRLASQAHERGSDVLAKKTFNLRYNGMGYLARIERDDKSIWQVATQDAANRLTEVLLGNGLAETREYFEGSGRLKASTLATAGKVRRLEEGYIYDNIGNVKERTQYWDTEGFTEYFTYDSLNRLESSKIDSDLRSFTYFADGRIRSKSGVGTGDYVYPQPGPGVVQPHAIKSIPGVEGEFSYDRNGNRTAGNGYTVTWTNFDMPKAIKRNGASSSFLYGSEYQRTVQSRSDGTAITTVTYAGAQEVETTVKDGTSLTKVKTYWPNGIGLEIEQAGETALYWTHTDRLGSVVALTKEDGTIAEKLAYDVWGKRRMLTSQATPDALDGKVDNKGFTGHEMLDQLDLVHMNGRVYDPLVGQFLSGDALVADPTNGQNYNRYSYVLNNPTNLIDPTGFEAIEDEDMPRVEIVGAGAGGGGAGGGGGGYISFTATVQTFTYVDEITPIAIVTLTAHRAPPSGIMQTGRFGSPNSGDKGLLSKVSDFFSVANRESNCGSLGCIHQGTGEATPVTHNTGNWMQDAVMDEYSKTASTVVNAGNQFANWWKNATLLGLGGIGEAGAVASSGVWGSIKATQPVWEGTVIPRSFELLAGGRQIWVHPNATEHMAEYAVGMLNRGVSAEAVALRSQAQLTSLREAVRQATVNGMPSRNIINVGGWELQFSRNTLDKLPVLKHALQH